LSLPRKTPAAVSVSEERNNTRGQKPAIIGDVRETWMLSCGRLNMVSLPPRCLFCGNGRFLQIVPVNAEVFVMAHEDERLRRLMETTINTVDGRVLQWICMLLYPGKQIVLLKGANFIHDLAGFCQSRGERLFLLGSNEGSNAGAVAKLRASYPGLDVSGFGPPLSQSPFDPPYRQSILERIETHRPHHLGVCFGPAKQEFWIEQNAHQLSAMGVRCAYGLGGTIDFLSGALPRAPRWVDQVGAEWLFRFICEPRRRWFRTLIQFKMPFYAAKTRRLIKPLLSL
jgi:N-acetylglucosaminyldiphosphoundecaprenol N-acetyl-beta-D-mannosaminyltransferase